MYIYYNDDILLNKRVSGFYQAFIRVFRQFSKYKNRICFLSWGANNGFVDNQKWPWYFFLKFKLEISLTVRKRNFRELTLGNILIFFPFFVVATSCSFILLFYLSINLSYWRKTSFYRIWLLYVNFIVDCDLTFPLFLLTILPLMISVSSSDTISGAISNTRS